MLGLLVFMTIVPTLLESDNPSNLESNFFQAFGAALGLVIAYFAIFGVNLLFAPYRQRNEARVALILEQPSPASLRIEDVNFNAESGDGRTKTALLKVRNIGDAPAIDCEVRLVTLVPLDEPNKSTIKMMPVSGSRFLWGHDDPRQKARTIGPKSWEHINIAWAQKNNIVSWWIFVEGGHNWPMPLGKYEIGVEVASQNTAPRSYTLTLSGSFGERLVVSGRYNSPVTQQSIQSTEGSQPQLTS